MVAARSRRALALLIVAGLASVALAGCFGARVGDARVVPYLEINDAGPGRATEYALLVKNAASFRREWPVSAEGLPEGWSFEPEHATLTVDGKSNRTVIVRVTPPGDALHQPLRWRAIVGDGGADLTLNVKDLGAEDARPGVGAQVRTVGLYENGTIFYTNMKEVRDNPSLFWHQLGENADADENMKPLKVYVGGKRGQKPPEPYAHKGYVPVIPGFDERLRGMRAGETLATRIAPEKAYTVPGNETHPLYGMSLTFLIQVVSVDVLPPADPVCQNLGVCSDAHASQEDRIPWRSSSSN